MPFTEGFEINASFKEWASHAEIKTLPQLFAASASKWGDRPYLGCRANGDFYFKTYSEINHEIYCLAAAFLELNFKRGDRVATFSTNRLEWPVIDFGAYHADCVHVPMYPTLSQAEMAYIVKDSAARILFVSSSEHLKKAIGALPICPGLEHIVVLDDVTLTAEQRAAVPEHVRIWSFQELLESGSANLTKQRSNIERILDELTADRVASLVYTSGTTGDPRGAMLMHGNFVSNAFALAPLVSMDQEDVELSFLPLSHVFERICYYTLTASGASIGYTKGIQHVPQDLKLLHPTIVPSVPRLFEKVFAKVIEMAGGGLKNKLFNSAIKVGRAYRTAKKQGKVSPFLKAQFAMLNNTLFAKIRATTGGKVRYFVSGGAPLRADVADFFLDVGLNILEGYGLTETSPVLTLNRPENISVGSVGEPVPGIEVRINDDGEVVAKGPNIMLGYFGRLEDTQKVIDEDGWFHTGDVGEFDEAGCLKITDRKKEILVLSNGKNVPPQPIENVLKMSPWIEQAVLIGNNRSFVSALIVPDFVKLEKWAKENGLEVSREELVEHEETRRLFNREIRELTVEFSNYEKIKRIAVLPRALSQDAGEITPTLKVKRRIVDKHYKDIIDNMYENTVQGHTYSQCDVADCAP